MTTSNRLGIVALMLALSGGAAGEEGIERTPAPEGAEVYFIAPRDGEQVRSPVAVRFGLRDYDPQSGRWTASDPMLFVGSPSTKSYLEHIEPQIHVQKQSKERTGVCLAGKEVETF